MLINVVSTSVDSKTENGPAKVAQNLCRGFDAIGQSYIINGRLDQGVLWIHDDNRALIDRPRGGPAVLGPNLAVLPSDLPPFVRLDRCVYLQPCAWARELWLREGFRRCPIDVWAAGIDTDLFVRSPATVADRHVLVYWKRRDPTLVQSAQAVLSEKGYTLETVTYGRYAQDDYLAALRRARFVVWIGRHESQGIALQEALSMNVPMVVLDAQSIFDDYPPAREHFSPRFADFPVTTAPYFDERCGVIIRSIAELRDAIDGLEAAFTTFAPRRFVEQHLSLVGQARKFVEIAGRVGSSDGVPPVGAPYRPSARARLYVRYRGLRQRLKSWLVHRRRA